MNAPPVMTECRISNKGFTLLEISIVILIIGLIIAATVTAQSLVRGAQLRRMAGEYDSYLKSIKEFQDKYLALPGDMNNAVTFWGAATTANGDGSGTIGTSNLTGTPADTAGTGGIANAGEWFLAWQHLTLAGFIPGSYPGTGTTTAIVGLGGNVPASQVKGAGWTLMFYLNTSGNAGLWSDRYGHVMAFGAQSSGLYTNGAVLTGAEALNIDNKFDDGLPGTGKIRAWRTGVLPNCTTNDWSQTAETYNNVAGPNVCALVFLLGF
jgi:prepilin-type N-terminal cleavage/methylation domain-containing protein